MKNFIDHDMFTVVKASIEINLGVINLIIAVLNKLFKTSVNMFY